MSEYTRATLVSSTPFKQNKKKKKKKMCHLLGAAKKQVVPTVRSRILLWVPVGM